MYVALCPELDVASQGDNVEAASANLKEAVELFLEEASPQEVQERLHTEVYISRFNAYPNRTASPNHKELKTGTLLSIVRQSGLPKTLFESRA